MSRLKKILVAIGIILVLFIGYITIDSYVFNNLKNKNNDKTIRVTYVTVDYDKTKNTDFSKFDNYKDSFLRVYSNAENLTKKGDNYIGKVNNISPVLLKNIAKTTFVINNVFGQVVEDCKFDEKTKELTIPKKYFEDKKYKNYWGKNGGPIRLEIVTRITEKELDNTTTDVYIKKFIKTKKQMVTTTRVEAPEVALFNVNKGQYINSNDFKIYLNDNKNYISEKSYVWDPKTGILTLKTSPLYYDKVTIKFKKSSLVKNFFSNLFHIKNAKAANAPSIDTKSVKINDYLENHFSTITNMEGANVSFDDEAGNGHALDYFYDTGDAYDGCFKNGTYYKNCTPPSATTAGNDLDTGSTYYWDFYVKLPTEIKFSKNVSGENKGEITIKFSKNMWLNLACIHGEQSQSNNTPLLPMDFKIVDVSISGDTATIEIGMDTGSATVGLQTAAGRFSVEVTKTITTPPDEPSGDLPVYQILIQKKHLNSAGDYVNWKKAGIKYELYNGYASADGTQCLAVDQIGSVTPAPLMGTETTGSNGIAAFDNLGTPGKYCVKEIIETGYNIDSDCDISNRVAKDVYTTQDGGALVITGSKTEGSYLTATLTGTPAHNPIDITYAWYREGYPLSIGNGPVYTVTSQDVDSTLIAVATAHYNDGYPEQTYRGTTNTNTNFITNEYCNYRKKYCIGINKKDSENNNPVSGIRFKVTAKNTSTINGQTQEAGDPPFISTNGNTKSAVTTNSNGFAKIEHLLFGGTYYFQENSYDGTSGYWNDSHEAKIPVDSIEENVVWNDENKSYDYVCPLNNLTTTVTDHKIYYCAKLAKVDETTGDLLPGSAFTTTNLSTNITVKDSDDGNNDGIVSFFRGTDSSEIKLTETTPPKGYISLSDSITLKPQPINKPGYSESQARNYCLNTSPNQLEVVTKFEQSGTTNEIKKINQTSGYASAPNRKVVLNWYKEVENRKRTNGALFVISTTVGNQTKYIKVNNPDSNDPIDDSNGTTKICYTFNGYADSLSQASQLESMNTKTNGSNSMGETCVVGLPVGTYKVTETKPVSYHTFGSVNEKTFTVTKNSTEYKPVDTGSNIETVANSSNTNLFIQKPTRFEFDKSVTSGDEDQYKNLTTQQLKQIEFNVYKINPNTGTITGNPLFFVLDSNGVYQYVENDVDGPGYDNANRTQSLYLNNNRKIIIEHLASGVTYAIKEKSTCCDDNCPSCTSSSTFGCTGFYYPKYTNTSDYTFTVNDCSNSSLNSSTQCSNPKDAKQELDNTPTEITFTKKDFYSYEDASDIVDFENDQERNDFDKIVFKLKESKTSSTYLTLLDEGDNGKCQTDQGVRTYRYVPSDMIQYLTQEQKSRLTSELHTCGGHIKITHLCRGKSFFIEEISVPEDSVFTLPQNVNDRIREYKIPCCEGPSTSTSTTQIISDKGTRVRFEKRDSKYNYLIPDETTTFEVYQCKKGTTCHPSNSSDTNIRKKIKFSPRAVINNDEEDPTDAEGLAGVEVYTAMSDSDVAAGKTNVTDLHPYHGILVLRYLQAGYNYVLLETKAPKNYTLPIGEAAETSFTVVNDRVDVYSIDVPNKPTSLLIKKYDAEGAKLLPGAQFKIYEGTTCDANLSPMNQPKTELKLKTIRDGLYEARPITDTSIIQTCDNANGTCNFTADTQTESGEVIELQEGEALIQYLEYNHCYIIEEVKAPKGHSLPENVEDRFTMITIKEDEKYAVDTGKSFINKPTPFTFYKYDEFNKLLDGAEFKLQKLDDNKKYNDLTVTKIEDKGNLFYKVDETSENKIITTKNGSATVYYLEPGQYRILEVTPAPGKELSKNPNIATFFVDDGGNVYGNSIIVNKSATSKYSEFASSTAQFIIAPRTGVPIIRYGLIIAVIVAIISGLMILKKKSK